MARSATLTSLPAATMPRLRPAALRAEHTSPRPRAQFLDGAGRASPRPAVGAAGLAVAWVLLWAFFLLAVVRPAAALHAHHAGTRDEARSAAYHAAP